MKKSYFLLWLCSVLTCVPFQSLAWNALGHRLIGQIAYNHLTPEVRRIYNNYNHALDEKYPPQSLVNAAAWLDTLHEEYPELSQQHYINLPFTKDQTPLKPPAKCNGLSAICHAKKQLQTNKGSISFEKGFALRILLHVVGDLHQPLHTVSYFSKDHLQGDKGGNLYLLGSNPIAPNLHAYWDRGGGLLKCKKRYSAAQVRRRSYTIQNRWPCDIQQMDLNPYHWVKESFQLAVNKAYSINMSEKPSKAYQEMVKNESEKQIALAGCRLAAVLNQLSDKLVQNGEK